MSDFGEQVVRKLEEGESFDQIFSELRAGGASPVDCISAVQAALKCDLAAAKKLVHNSVAWADRKDEHDQLQSPVADALWKTDSPRSSFPALCLFLSVFFIVFAGMVLCDCPGAFFISVVFAGLAFWRGTKRQRVVAMVILLFSGFMAIWTAW
jgi:hypothetical protein